MGVSLVLSTQEIQMDNMCWNPNPVSGPATLWPSAICISFGSSIFSSLTYTHIENVVYIHSQPSHLIEALNACPALERFQLTNTHFRSAFPDPTMQANLPFLKHFFLYEILLEAVQYILASITTPPTACLSLNLPNATIDTAFSPDVDYTTHFPNISRIRRLSVTSIFHFLKRDNVIVAGYDGPSTKRGDSAQLLTLELQSTQLPAMESVLSTLERLPMPVLESLELTGFTHAAFTTAKVSHLLAESTTVKTLSPRRETLRVCGSDVGVETLVEVVRSRQAFDCPLMELEIEDCKLIDRASVEQLEALGITVKWIEAEDDEDTAA
ncbi:hypothetical protein BOTBODRAFT_147586 [Botryobasidium botryosum FD-172 SS1]|uniref:F-box domain-containing protein n=1 Tax=Botryobasidium botryosum (strain FD-172 SS1) TaxID=930990 RepID=A0A067MGE1_BOTB1|nr:hypothetical protein BOTBODRAFT_147586 [Botryobasidium botryosum FD-172 SS1]